MIKDEVEKVEGGDGSAGAVEGHAGEGRLPHGQVDEAPGPQDLRHQPGVVGGLSFDVVQIHQPFPLGQDAVDSEV